MCCCKNISLLGAHAVQVSITKGIVLFYFPDKFVDRSFIQITKSCFSLFPKSYILSVFPGKSSSANHSVLEEPLFLIQLCCDFFLPHFCVCFCFVSFPGKVHMSFIHSIFKAGKKNNQEIKKQNFHSFKKYPPKVRKNEFIRVKNNEGTLV